MPIWESRVTPIPRSHCKRGEGAPWGTFVVIRREARRCKHGPHTRRKTLNSQAKNRSPRLKALAPRTCAPSPPFCPFGVRALRSPPAAPACTKGRVVPQNVRFQHGQWARKNIPGGGSLLPAACDLLTHSLVSIRVRGLDDSLWVDPRGWHTRERDRRYQTLWVNIIFKRRRASKISSPAMLNMYSALKA